MHKNCPPSPKEQGGDIVDKEAQIFNPNTPEILIRGLQELEKLRQRALKALPKIKAPVLIAHGEKDRTIPPRASIHASQQCVAQEVILHPISISGHVLPIDLEHKEVQKALRLFITSQNKAMSAISKTPRFPAALAVEKVIGEDIFGVVLNQVLSQTNLSDQIEL